jgi:hypothetical protein
MEAMNQLMSSRRRVDPPAGQPGQEWEGAGARRAARWRGQWAAAPGQCRKIRTPRDPSGRDQLDPRPRHPGTAGPAVPPLQVFGANGNRPGTGRRDAADAGA